MTVLTYLCVQGRAKSGAVHSVNGFGTFTSWYALLPFFGREEADVLKIPSYALFKIWTNFIGPMIGRSSDNSSEASTSEKSTLSKRQEKLRKRSEKGDPRVRTVHK